MTQDSRVFRNPFDDKWYFWDEAWASTQGPYEEYVEAHAALTAVVEQARAGQAPNCG